MIQPDQIPQFTGDLAQLELDHAALKKDAGNVRTTGKDVHSQFQGLSAFYQAPEAEKLFATTKPVQEKADAFAGDLETVSSALSSYATEIRPLVAKLKELKTKAHTFVDSVKDDDEWEYDGDKVDEHNQIRDDITNTVAAFWAAERTCHNKITAIWGGTQMVAGDGSERTDQYGFSAEDMQNAKLPWGDPVEEKHHWYEVGHWVKSFVWDGLIVDGIWGTIKGLGTLVGFGGWEAMGQAWKGLAQLATGLAITAIPGVGTAFWLLPDDKLPSWIRDSRTAMKETGKALVAWDEWGKNPGRAAGAVTFNVLTTVFTGGAGAGVAGAGKAGAVARVLGTAGKVIDPMTYIAKGAGAGLSKIGDISAALKGVGNIDIPTLPNGTVQLPDGNLMDPNGNLLTPNGTTIDSTPTMPHNTAPASYPTNPAGLPSHWTIQTPDTPAFPGAAHMADNTIPTGTHTTPDGVPAATHTAPDGFPAAAHTADNTVPTATHTAPDGVHGGTPHPTGSAAVPSGTAPSPWYHDTPTTAATHDVPTTTPHGTGGPDVPTNYTDDAAHGTGHTDDAAHAGDHTDVGDSTGLGDTAVDVGLHHGADVPVSGHADDMPGRPGSGEPFAYEPRVSADEFDNLSGEQKHAVARAELERGTNPYPSTSDAAGKAYGDAYWNGFLDNLDPKAKGALQKYSDFYYQTINGQLRDTHVPLKPEVQDLVDDMDRVMGARPVPEDIMVVRGTGFDHILDEPDIDSLLDMEGRTFTDEGFTSTSLGKNAAFDYKPMIMHLRVPQGTPALWIDHISVNKGERELLLARGTEYKVTRVFQEGGKWHVYGEVVPKP
ncbi:ADP-ribosyltransferase [Streptomyces sp. NPDC018693]|uniref:ADP-ribosyltransferase n=1 Tax=unclassified Streptomyces TaxID=2593676 RepID=UPI0037B7ACB8